MIKPTMSFEELFFDRIIRTSCEIVLAYNQKFGTKKPNSDEEADENDIMAWYHTLSAEEREEIDTRVAKSYEDDIKDLMGGLVPGPEGKPCLDYISDFDDSLISHVGYSDTECGYGEAGK